MGAGALGPDPGAPPARRKHRGGMAEAHDWTAPAHEARRGGGGGKASGEHRTQLFATIPKALGEDRSAAGIASMQAAIADADYALVGAAGTLVDARFPQLGAWNTPQPKKRMPVPFAPPPRFRSASAEPPAVAASPLGAAGHVYATSQHLVDASTLAAAYATGRATRHAPSGTTSITDVVAARRKRAAPTPILAWWDDAAGSKERVPPTAPHQQLRRSERSENADNFFPLEHFDDAKESKQAGADGAIRSGATGLSLWSTKVDGGVPTEWRPCTVVRTADEGSRLLIEWHENGKQKWISRLNFRYVDDSSLRHEERRAEARAQRAVEEARLLRDLQLKRVALDARDSGTVPLPAGALFRLKTHLDEEYERVNRHRRWMLGARNTTIQRLVEEASEEYVRAVSTMTFDAAVWTLTDGTGGEAIGALLGDKRDSQDSMAAWKAKQLSRIPVVMTPAAFDARQTFEQQSFFAREHLCSIILEARNHLNRACHFRIFDNLANKEAGTTRGFGDFFKDLERRRDEFIDTMQNDVVGQLRTLVNDVRRIDGPDIACRMAKLFNAMLLRCMAEVLEDSIDAALNDVMRAAYADEATFHISLEYRPGSGRVEYVPALNDFAASLVEQVSAVHDAIMHLRMLKPNAWKDDDGFDGDTLAPCPEVARCAFEGIQPRLRCLEQAIEETVRSAGTQQETPASLRALFEMHAGLVSGFAGEMYMQQIRERAAGRSDAALVDEWDEAIAQLRREEIEVIKELPGLSRMGMFIVYSGDLRIAMVHGARKLSHEICAEVTKEVDVRCVELSKRLHGIIARARRPVKSLEEMRDTVAFLRDTGEVLDGVVRDSLEGIRNRQDLLDRFKHLLSDETFGIAIRVGTVLEEEARQALVDARKALPELREHFAEELHESINEFGATIKALREEVAKWKDVYGFDDAEKHAGNVNKLMQRIEAAAATASLIQMRQDLLGEAKNPYTEFHAMRTSLHPYVQLWNTCVHWQQSQATWFYGPIMAFDMEAVEACIPQWLATATKLEEVLGGAPFRVAKILRVQLEEFRRQLPVLRSIRTVGMRERHWTEISRRTGIDRSTFSPEIRDQELTLEMLVRLGAMKCITPLREVADLASRENTVERAIEALASEWNAAEVILHPHLASRSRVLRNGDTVIDALDEAMLKIQALSLSPYVGPYIDRVTYWAERLGQIHETLVMWLDVQRRYVHLYPLFRSTQDASTAVIEDMPLESAKFGQIDDEWKHTVTEIIRKDDSDQEESGTQTVRIMDVMNRVGAIARFAHIGSMLDSIMKGLRTFLGRKRAAFPRLGLVSDEELLDALKLLRDPECPRRYVPRLFPGCATVEMLHMQIDAEQDGKAMEGVTLNTIAGLRDPYGEVLHLRRPCPMYRMSSILRKQRRRSSITTTPSKADDKEGTLTVVGHKALEEWLSDLETQMMASVNACIQDAVESYPGNETEIASDSTAALDGDDAHEGTVNEALEDAEASEAFTDRSQDDGASAGNMQASAEAGVPPANTIDAWVLGHVSQAVLAVNAMAWTAEVERALDTLVWEHDGGAALQSVCDDTSAHLETCVRRVRRSLASKLEHASIGAFLVRTVYHRDISSRLAISQPQRGCADFEWVRCLRYYREDSQAGAEMRLTRETSATPSLFAAAGNPIDAPADPVDFATFRVMIRCALADIPYGNEYLGCIGHLVVTPITERAYVAMATALALNLAPAPQGPAGTGKTETSKDIARLCGRHIVTVNCSEGVDIYAITRLLEGIAGAGSWACFDELNRLTPGVLSFVSSLLLKLQMACRAREATCEFDGLGERGSRVAVSERCACFVTLNPSYMNRNPLPESLSALLRPIAIMGADLRYICEVQLFAIGFSNAPTISAKLACFLRTMQTQVEQRSYHDFKMRALRAVLDAMERLRADALSSPVAQRRRNEDHSSPEAEETICRQALLQTVKPRLRADETHTCVALVDELFPHSLVRANSKSSWDVQSKALKSVAFEWHQELRNSGQENGWNADVSAFGDGSTGGQRASVPVLKRIAKGAIGRDPHLVRCASCLADTLAVRAGVIVLGRAGTGKSACIQLLAETVNYLMATQTSMVDLRYVNSCAVPPDCVYGVLDQAAGEWSDGVITMHLRSFAALHDSDFPHREEEVAPSSTNGEEENGQRTNVLGPLWGDMGDAKHRWLVLDGPLFSVHAESLNSVLDDTRELFLSTGEVIPLLPNARVLFEVDTLAYATPATVSRCGVVHVEQVASEVNDAMESAECERLVLAWYDTLPSTAAPYRSKLDALMRHFLYPMVQSIGSKHGSLATQIHFDSVANVSNFLRLYSVYLELLTNGKNLFSVSPSAIQDMRGAEGVLVLGNTKQDVKGILETYESNWHSQLSSQGMRMRLECLFVQGIVATLGSVLCRDGRSAFSQQLRKLCARSYAKDTKHRSSSDATFALPYPEDGNVFDYCFDIAACEWRIWGDVARLSQYDAFIRPQFDLLNPAGPLSTTLAEGLCIPSHEDAMALQVVDLLAARGHHLAIYGRSGSGKTTVARSCIDRSVPMSVSGSAAVGEDEHDTSLGVCQLALSSSTRVDSTMRFLGQHVKRKQGSLFGPGVGKRGVVLFCDDMHLAGGPRSSGESVTELVRQLADTRGFYQPSWRRAGGGRRQAAGSGVAGTGSPPPLAPLEHGRVRHVQLIVTLQSHDVSRVGSRAAAESVSPRVLRHMAVAVLPEACSQRASGLFCSYMNLRFHGQDAMGLDYLESCARASAAVVRLVSEHPLQSGAHKQSLTRSAARVMDTIATHAARRLEPEHLALLWSHEARREFVDSLDSAGDVANVNRRLRFVVEKHFPNEVGNNTELLNMHLDDGPTPITFTNLLLGDPARDSGAYETQNTETADFFPAERVSDTYALRLIDAVAKTIEDGLAHQDGVSGDSHRQLEAAVAQGAFVVPFASFTVHVNRLVRILRRPNGHALLLGMHGRGKRTIARTAASLCGIKDVMEIRCAEGLSEHAVADILKRALESAGARGKPTMLLMHDDDKLPKPMAHAIEHLLRTQGLAPPGVWGINDEDLQPLLDSTLRAAAKGSGGGAPAGDESSAHLTGSQSDVAYDLFVRRCRQNLRICWCGNALITSTLVNHTTVMYVPPWTADERHEVAIRAFSPLYAMPVTEEIPRSSGNDAKLAPISRPSATAPLASIARANLADACAAVHEAVAQNGDFAQPASEADYVEFLRVACQVLYRRLATLQKDFVRYHEGLRQMALIEDRIGAMKDELTSLEQSIDSATSSIEALLRTVESKQAQAKEESVLMTKEEKVIEEAVVELTGLRDDANREIEKVMPPLLAAIKDLEGVQKADLVELKSMHNPPSSLQWVLRAVCILLGREPQGLDERAEAKLKPDAVDKLWWREAQRFLSEQNVLGLLVNFDRDGVDQERIARIDHITAQEWFNPDRVRRVSKAGECMCKWVLAMDLYYDSMQVIKPKQDALSEAEKALNDKEERLRATKESIAELKTSISNLKMQAQTAIGKREKLYRDSAEAAERIRRATDILEGFNSERTRWTARASALESEQGHALGDALMAATHLVYLCSMHAADRAFAMERVAIAVRHAKVPMSSSFELGRVLSVTPTEESRWEVAGLPGSKSCLTNAHIIFGSRKAVYVMDPEQRAAKWLRSLLRDSPRHAFVSASELLSSSSAESASDLAKDTLTKMHRAHARLYSAVVNGTCCILERVGEKLSQAVEDLLHYNVAKRGPSTNFTRGLNAYGVDIPDDPSTARLSQEYAISMCGLLMPYDPRATVILVSTLPTVSLPQDLRRSVTVVDFGINESELEAQLVHHVIQIENATLLNELANLRALQLRAREDMEQAESELLLKLAKIDVRHVLETDDVVSLLSGVREASERLDTKLTQLGGLRKKHDDFAEIYARPIAKRAAVSFDTLRSIAHASPSYIFSLEWFVQCVFNVVIERSRSPSDTSAAVLMHRSATMAAARATDLESNFAKAFYWTVSYSLFEKHHLPFAFMLAVRLLGVSNPSVAGEVRLFLGCAAAIDDIRNRRRDAGLESDDDEDDEDDEEEEEEEGGGGDGGGAGNDMNGNKLERPTWIAPATWRYLRNVCEHNGLFKGLDESICGELPGQSALDWERFASSRRSSQPFPQGLLSLPGPWNMMSPVCKLVVLRLLAPMRTEEAIVELVQDALGHPIGSNAHQMHADLVPKAQQSAKRTVDVKLDDAYERSTCSRPILILALPGEDPTSRISAYAMHKRRRLFNVSMSATNEHIAMNAIEQERIKARWVLMNNVHLSSDRFRSELLPHILENVISDPTTDYNFRLFLVAAPTFLIPAPVYALSHKVVAEPSFGSLQGHMASGWTVFGAGGGIEFEEDGQRHPRMWRRMLLAISLFHALLLERKRFGVYGWCAPNDHLGAFAGEYRGPAVTPADLETCRAELKRLFLDCSSPESDWPMKLYFANVVASVYAAKCTDAVDRRVLRALSHPFTSFEQYSQRHRRLWSVTHFLVENEAAEGDGISNVKHLPDEASLVEVKAHAMQGSVDAAYEASHVHREFRKARFDLHNRSVLVGIHELMSGGDEQAPAVDDAEDADNGALVDASQRLSDMLARMNKLDFGEIRASPIGNQLADEITRIRSFLKQALADLGSIRVGNDDEKGTALAMPDDAARCVMRGLVPDAWVGMVWPLAKPLPSAGRSSPSLGGFVSRMEARCDYLEGWHVHGALSPPDLGVPLPIVVTPSMHGLPRAIFDAALRNHARLTNTSLDELTFCVRFTVSRAGTPGGVASPMSRTQATSRRRSSVSGRRAISAVDSSTISLGGLRLCGAMWDARMQCLVDTVEGSDSAVEDKHDRVGTSFPLVWLVPCPRSGTPTDESLFHCDLDLVGDLADGRGASGGVESSKPDPTPVRTPVSTRRPARQRGALVPPAVSPGTPFSFADEQRSQVTSTYLCPLYTSMDRVGQNHKNEGALLLAIPLPCGKHDQAHWVRRNVFLTLDDDA